MERVDWRRWMMETDFALEISVHVGYVSLHSDTIV